MFVHLPPAIHARVQCMGVRDLHQVKQIKYYTEHSECHMSGMPLTCVTQADYVSTIINDIYSRLIFEQAYVNWVSIERY